MSVTPRRWRLVLWCLLVLSGAPSARAGEAVAPLPADPGSAPPTTSQTLAGVRKTGILRVGIKADFPPFGMVDAHGKPIGFEIDLARDIAQRLGVTPELVRVTSENRLQQLEQGAVDLLLATTADTAERRKIVTAIEPGYYAGGVTLMLRSGQRHRDWASLRGQTVCATQGAYFNRPMSERYVLSLQLYRDTRDALLGLRDGRCIGFLYSNGAIDGFLAKEEWAGYEAPLPLAMVTPWAIMLSRREQGSAFERILGDVVADWHRAGFLIAREEAWGIRPSQYLRDLRARWTARDAAGHYQCERTPTGAWPLPCRDPAIITYRDVSGFQNLGLLLKEWAGIDLSFIYDPYDRTRFFWGLSVTVCLMVSCVLLSLILGCLGALAADARRWWVAGPARALAIQARMTPPLLNMYLIFFGIGGLLFAELGISLYPMLVAIWCMSYYTGGAIMTNLHEAAKHLRETRPAFRLSARTIKEAAQLARGPVLGSLINVMKQTVMASAIAVPELLSASLAIMAERGNVTVMMNVLLLTYLLLITLAIRIISWLQRRLNARPGHP